MVLMRLFAAILIVSLAMAAPVFGQAGALILADDTRGEDCDLEDKSAGIRSFLVVHVSATNVAACMFSAPVPACFTGTWLSDTPQYPVTLGDSQNGISVGYGECLSSPIHVMTINFFCQGTSSNCCYYKIFPHPDVESGEVEVADCFGNVIPGIGGRAVVNPTASCPCGPPTQDSTWGRVKSLYDKP
jgi:hypothetical protein